MVSVVVVGCGVVGAAIAYELSLIPGLAVSVLDGHPPAQASTGAALGVLMGVVSQKVKGRLWALRHQSLTRYDSLIAELETQTGRTIPVNRQGVVVLTLEGDPLEDWDRLIALRQQQGWTLERWQRSHLQARCPQVDHPQVTGAVYSPQDRQIDPTALTLALVDAAARNGVSFQFGQPVEGLILRPGEPRCAGVTLGGEQLTADWVVLAAGLGTTVLSQGLPQPIELAPVLGQAMRVRLEVPLGDRTFQPVLTGNDTHLVPLGNGEYWVGATVEFLDEQWDGTADPSHLNEVWQRAIAFWPGLRAADIVQTWAGLRPRPRNRPAPVLEPLTGYENVLLATGHYRNGVLLAPATALHIRDWILGGMATPETTTSLQDA